MGDNRISWYPGCAADRLHDADKDAERAVRHLLEADFADWRIEAFREAVAACVRHERLKAEDEAG